MGKLNPYDEVFYPGYPFPQTHPDRLATLATLFGMKPAPIESCRVLELGCGDGANLIPMAFALTDSQFMGIDSAGLPIAKGKALIEELGLRNISLQQADVMDLSEDFGRFDYIIAHGLYSWVALDVQDKILSICKTNLAPQGVAYVSYNTYPGGHLRRMIREMMLFHVRNLKEQNERISGARGLVKFLAEAQPKSDEYAMFLKKELDIILARADAGIYHDDLAAINSPVYFYQFVEHAKRHGLQYLAEAELLESQTSIYPPLRSQEWKQLGHDLIAQEQYFDFLKCRMFRQTLLCHGGVVPDRSLRPDLVRNFYVASSARPVSAKPNVASPNVVEEFRASNGVTLSTGAPLAKVVLWYLGEIWPQWASFEELVQKARAPFGEAQTLDEQRLKEQTAVLCDAVLMLYGCNFVELHVSRPTFAATVSDRPRVSSLARAQARQGHILTTLRHTMVEVKDDLARNLLMLLDGTKDRDTLVKELTSAMEGGRVIPQLEGAHPSNQNRAFTISPEDLEQKLYELARLALLVA